MKNIGEMKKIPAEIDDPQKLTITAYHCIDSGGWYIRFSRYKTMMEIDKDCSKVAETKSDIAKELQVSSVVTHAINGGDIELIGRLKNTRIAKSILN